MFGLFGITRDANKAHSYLDNFIGYATESMHLFGFEKAAKLISASEWAAGPQARVERNFSYVHFRLCIPFSSFFCTIDDELTLNDKPSDTYGKLTLEAADDFQGFGLFKSTDQELVQVYAANSPLGRATARACMLMSRFKAKGATDVTNAMRGIY